MNEPTKEEYDAAVQHLVAATEKIDSLRAELDAANDEIRDNGIEIERLRERDEERDQVYGETMARWVEERKALHAEIKELEGGYSYPGSCSNGHPEVGHEYVGEGEICPVCQAMERMDKIDVARQTAIRQAADLEAILSYVEEQLEGSEQ